MSTSLTAIKLDSCRQELNNLDVEIKNSINGLMSSDPADKLMPSKRSHIQNRIYEFSEKLVDFADLVSAAVAKNSSSILQEELNAFRRVEERNSESFHRSCQHVASVSDYQSREQLFQQSNTSSQHSSNSQSKMTLGASEATEGLSHLVRQMHEQVKVSEETLLSLTNSSKTLANSEVEMRSIHGSIQTSNKLLSKYSRRECTDKVLIFLAFLLFFGTAFYIAKKRVIGW